ncbi:hypothetical protein MNB_ARC-1_1047 [hydrothermal vent metagenome]|uniref:DUF3817 domain-containing protein n=1 Tax=hydrothermal vent metagenome TaxID=652676 RepID=A0A3B1DS99_9ZZZZ
MKKIKIFKTVATIEGISFLLLLFIAMPLKYIYAIPEATKIVGMIHGGFFLWFLYAQYEASHDVKWGIKFNILAFLLSIIPFGTFYLNKRLKEFL